MLKAIRKTVFMHFKKLKVSDFFSMNNRLELFLLDTATTFPTEAAWNDSFNFIDNLWRKVSASGSSDIYECKFVDLQRGSDPKVLHALQK